jgi:hypothetical protein
LFSTQKSQKILLYKKIKKFYSRLKNLHALQLKRHIYGNFSAEHHIHFQMPVAVTSAFAQHQLSLMPATLTPNTLLEPGLHPQIYHHSMEGMQAQHDEDT